MSGQVPIWRISIFTYTRMYNSILDSI
jgi:hypothetical protein